VPGSRGRREPTRCDRGTVSGGVATPAWDSTAASPSHEAQVLQLDFHRLAHGARVDLTSSWISHAQHLDTCVFERTAQRVQHRRMVVGDNAGRAAVEAAGSRADRRSLDPRTVEGARDRSTELLCGDRSKDASDDASPREITNVAGSAPTPYVRAVRSEPS
jgi:hypothetical protein